jgi:hypothetical protein
MKRKVKRFAAGKEVEIEERSTKSDRLKAEELGKGPDDYATMGARARATSPFSGPKEYISESKEVETETEIPKGIAAGFSAKRYLEESEPKGGGSTSETKPAVAKKTAKKPVSKRVSQSFGVDEAGMEERRKTPMSTAKKPPLARIGKAIAGTVERASTPYKSQFMKKHGGSVKMASGGTASSRADGCAQRGKTRGKMV